jgi:hypothetical protein
MAGTGRSRIGHARETGAAVTVATDLMAYRRRFFVHAHIGPLGRRKVCDHSLACSRDRQSAVMRFGCMQFESSSGVRSKRLRSEAELRMCVIDLKGGWNVGDVHPGQSPTHTWRALNKQTEHAIDAREIFALLGLQRQPTPASLPAEPHSLRDRRAAAPLRVRPDRRRSSIFWERQ